MSNVVRIASSQRDPQTRACNTCRHRPRIFASLAICKATGGYVDFERAYDQKACGPSGRLWEPMPPPVPVLTRFKRWLIG
jgi:hypothetical protein